MLEDLVSLYVLLLQLACLSDLNSQSWSSPIIWSFQKNSEARISHN